MLTFLEPSMIQFPSGDLNDVDDDFNASCFRDESSSSVHTTISYKGWLIYIDNISNQLLVEEHAIVNLSFFNQIVSSNSDTGNSNTSVQVD